ncbi:Ff.00g019910.m01.CDS01 [Fusarium sp. VM40]|nr:Ff.00g019910.m01.CDS01 [Fusarium sp. VM40]
MRFSTALFTSAFTAFTSTAVAEESFQQWWHRTAEAVGEPLLVSGLVTRGFAKRYVAVFPNVTGWEVAVNELMTSDTKITFNAKELDLEGLKKYWSTIPPIIESDYEYLVLTMDDAVALPAEEGRGGNAYMTGTEVGLRKGAEKTVTARQALYAVFGDDRKATEWHEVVNELK